MGVIVVRLRVFAAPKLVCSNEGNALGTFFGQSGPKAQRSVSRGVVRDVRRIGVTARWAFCRVRGRPRTQSVALGSRVAPRWSDSTGQAPWMPHSSRSKASLFGPSCGEQGDLLFRRGKLESNPGCSIDPSAACRRLNGYFVSVAESDVGWIVAFRSAKVARNSRYFRGAKGDKGLSATKTTSASVLFFPFPPHRSLEKRGSGGQGPPAKSCETVLLALLRCRGC